LEEDGPVLEEVEFELPPDCAAPEGRSILYSAVAFGPRVYATLFCGATVLSAPLP
jgi:hypothetical protein